MHIAAFPRVGNPPFFRTGYYTLGYHVYSSAIAIIDVSDITERRVHLRLTN